MQYTELERYATHYYPHSQQKNEVIRLGQYTCDKDYEVVNENPVKFQVNVYYRMLTRVESTQRLETRKAQRYAGNALLLAFQTSDLDTCTYDDLDSLLQVLEETSDSIKANNQDACTTTPATVLDNLVEDIDCPPDSPSVPTPLLASPIRKIVINDMEITDEAGTSEDVNIMPLLLGTDSDTHPSSDWNMVSTA